MNDKQTNGKKLAMGAPKWRQRVEGDRFGFQKLKKEGEKIQRKRRGGGGRRREEGRSKKSTNQGNNM